MAQIIKVDGSTEALTDLSLASLQAAVGGYIQLVSTPDGKTLICDEEGKCKDKPINAVATKLYANPYDVIVGDAILDEAGEID